MKFFICWIIFISLVGIVFGEEGKVIETILLLLFGTGLTGLIIWAGLKLQGRA